MTDARIDLQAFRGNHLDVHMFAPPNVLSISSPTAEEWRNIWTQSSPASDFGLTTLAAVQAIWPLAQSIDDEVSMLALEAAIANVPPGQEILIPGNSQVRINRMLGINRPCVRFRGGGAKVNIETPIDTLHGAEIIATAVTALQITNVNPTDAYTGGDVIFENLIFTDPTGDDATVFVDVVGYLGGIDVHNCVFRAPRAVRKGIGLRFTSADNFHVVHSRVYGFHHGIELRSSITPIQTGGGNAAVPCTSLAIERSLVQECNVNIYIPYDAYLGVGNGVIRGGAIQGFYEYGIQSRSQRLVLEGVHIEGAFQRGTAGVYVQSGSLKSSGCDYYVPPTTDSLTAPGTRHWTLSAVTLGEPIITDSFGRRLTVGVYGTDTGLDFYWVYGTADLYQDAASTFTGAFTATFPDPKCVAMKVGFGVDRVLSVGDYIQGAVESDNNSIAQFIQGDGSTRLWVLQQRVTEIVSVQVDGIIKTVGVEGIDTGKDFYYVRGDRRIWQDTGGTTLTSDHTLLVNYNPGAVVPVFQDPQYFGTDFWLPPGNVIVRDSLGLSGASAQYSRHTVESAAFDVRGPIGADAGIDIAKVGTTDADNIRYRLSHRGDNKELWLYSRDSDYDNVATFINWLRILYDSGVVEIPVKGLVSGAEFKLQGPASGFTELILQKIGALSSSNVRWEFSHRNNDQDFYLFSNDGTTFANWFRALYASGIFELPQDVRLMKTLIFQLLGGAKFLGTNGGGTVIAKNSVDLANDVTGTLAASHMDLSGIESALASAGFLTTTTGDARYYTKTDADATFATQSQLTIVHDSLQSQIDSLTTTVAGKSGSGHTHDYSGTDSNGDTYSGTTGPG